MSALPFNFPPESYSAVYNEASANVVNGKTASCEIVEVLQVSSPSSPSTSLFSCFHCAFQNSKKVIKKDNPAPNNVSLFS
ncbi:unnamed protein product [Pieris brassicae]|uniref:Uncharacterized protein n=1 Tax=Pieris brassicae TaxID=7116 RepID=A0A9P0XJH3_PIEBR|nr:unnamed protein product [Pieris brassicae]